MSLILKVKGADFSNSGLNPIIPTANGFPSVGLKNLYLFNDSAASQVIVDSSGNNNHLAKSIITKTVAGYSFEGEDSIMLIPSDGALNGTLLIAWYTNTNSNETLDPNTSHNVFSTRTENNDLRNTLYYPGSSLSFLAGGGNASSSLAGINVDDWLLSTAQWDSTTLGGLTTLIANNKDLINASPVTVLGEIDNLPTIHGLGGQISETGSGTNPIHGEIGIVAIYDRVLSSFEIAIAQEKINTLMLSRGVTLT